MRSLLKNNTSNSIFQNSLRTYLTGEAITLNNVLKPKVAQHKEIVAQLKKENGSSTLGPTPVESVYSGMRGITGLVYEPSLLDSMEGIRFRGLNIHQCRLLLPKWGDHGEEPLPEAMFYLLLTGEVPTMAQAAALNADLVRRSKDPVMDVARKAIEALPEKTHPMTQFSIGILALQTGSIFSKAYSEGKAHKKNYGELALEDSLNCIARVPSIAAQIYRRYTNKPLEVPKAQDNLDWAGNFTHQLGFTDPKFMECLRLYLSIHTDHEGGNVSAHTATLVASALSDPYLSLSASMNGLAGPLHGLANQEVLTFLFDMLEKCKAANVDMTNDAQLKEKLTEFTWDLLGSGRVVPGYGHAVLRMTDPRYTCQREFCLRNFPDDNLFRLVDSIYHIMPDILTKHGKTKNPYPNVDAHSGVLLQYYGLKEQDFYTVLFGVSRQMGVLSAIVWDRMTGKAIERPKSITTEALAKKFLKKD